MFLNPLVLLFFSKYWGPNTLWPPTKLLEGPWPPCPPPYRAPMLSTVQRNVCTNQFDNASLRWLYNHTVQQNVKLTKVKTDIIKEGLYPGNIRVIAFVWPMLDYCQRCAGQPCLHGNGRVLSLSLLSGVPILLCGTGAGPQQGYAINIPYASVWRAESAYKTERLRHRPPVNRLTGLETASSRSTA